MQYNDRVKANPSVVLREEFDDWAILFNPDSGVIFSLNPMGVYIWKCFDGNHTIRDILENLRNDCEDVPDDAETHLKDFISDLIEKGLAGYKE
jgi:SynChlorMet cassette protein ScmD